MPGERDKRDRDPSSPSDDDPLLRAIARAPSRPLDPKDEVDPVRVAHFKIAGRLGSGGMGVVYRAQDESLRREVALKLLPAVSAGNPERRQRFLREARVAASLVHPNVAVVHQVGESDGRVYIAMELVDGVTLRQRLEAGPLSIAVVRDLALQIAQGLAAAHAKGIVHRDLKPENVMVTDSGGVKLLDFGLAKSGWVSDSDSALGNADTEAQITREGDVLGSSAYMSPEQALGMTVDARSDVFSFGIVLYEMLAGRRPFGGKSLGEIRAAIAREQPVPLGAGADAGLAGIVRKCLEKRAEDRYEDAGVVVLELAALSRVSERQPRESREVATEPPARRRHGLVIVASSVVVGVVIAAVVVEARHRIPAATATGSAPVPSASVSVVPFDDGATPSSNSEAQRAFEAALQSVRDGAAHETQLLRHAVELDPSFGAAELRLSVWGTDDWQAHFRRAQALEKTLSTRDRAILDAIQGNVACGGEGTTSEAAFDRYLERYPHDLAAWGERAWISADCEDRDHLCKVIDRALAANPIFPKLLRWKGRCVPEDEHLANMNRCLSEAPRCAECLQARMGIESGRGECEKSAADARELLSLDIDPTFDIEARDELANALAANDVPIEGVREAMGSLEESEGIHFEVPRAVRMALYEGDFAEAVRVATDIARTAESSRELPAHHRPMAALLAAYGEMGDSVKAAQVAKDYLTRAPAWSYGGGSAVSVPARAADGVATAMVRGRLLSQGEAEAKRRDAFEDSVRTRAPLDAWGKAYGEGIRTAEEARAALAAFDAAHLSPDSVGERSQWAAPLVATAFVLAGRPGPIRALFEPEMKSCSVLNPDPVGPIRSHFYLGLYEEREGNKGAACAHYAAVLSRWGHAKPRSVTADEARTRSHALHCPQP